jgi:thiol-disulfide isomerase/thioredoxin
MTMPEIMTMIATRRSLSSLVPAAVVAAVLSAAGGCGSRTDHPAIGRTMGRLPLTSMADQSRRTPRYEGKVTLLNFWGTWCMPCRRELPGLLRIAKRLESEPAFQLVAVSCGTGGPDELAEISATTRDFLTRERFSLDAWADPDGMARLVMSESYEFTAFPTTYLVGPDARVRAVWVGYRSRDEADMARAIVAALRELPQGPEPPAAVGDPGPPIAR